MIWSHFIHIIVMWRKRKIKEMVVWNGNKNKKTPERAKMKKEKKEKKEMEWPQRGWIKKRVRSLGWKTQKFTPGRL